MGSHNILALDTSSNYCSVALQYNGIIKQIHSSSVIERSQKLLIIIDKLLNKIPIEELNALAFAAGPGSLTGLKIASCIIQALHLVYKKPIIKVSTLQALALSARAKYDAEFIIPCIDAKMGQIYYGVYKFDAGTDLRDRPDLLPYAVQKDTIGSPEEILKLNYTAMLVGDGTKILQQNTQYNQYNQLNIHTKLKISPTLIYPNAESIVKIASYWYKKYGIISSDADPIYLRSNY